MPFFKETISYELVSLLDKLKIKREFVNLILFIIKFTKFRISKKIQIFHKSSNTEKIDLFMELFKERYYLDQLVRNNNIEATSQFNYILNNNILLSEISYGNNIRFNVEYTISDCTYSIYITVNDRCFNATEDNLNIKSIYEVFNKILNLMRMEICYIFTELYAIYWK